MASIEPLIPAAKRGGRRRKTDMRQTFNAVMYLLSTGANGAIFPRIFPRKARCAATSTPGTGAGWRMHDALYEFCRAQEARGQPHRRDHRQSEREERRKRSRIDPHGSTQQENQGKKRHFLAHTRLVAHRHSSFGRYSGSLMVAAAPALFSMLVGPAAFLSQAVRRQRLSRTIFATAIGESCPVSH